MYLFSLLIISYITKRPTKLVNKKGYGIRHTLFRLLEINKHLQQSLPNQVERVHNL